MAIGGGMLALCLAVAWFAPEPSPLQERSVLVIMALGGAFLAAGLTGMIETEARVANLTIRASGSLAVFVLIYFGDVSTRVSEQNLPPRKLEAVEQLTRKVAQGSGTDVEGRLDQLAKRSGYASFRQMKVSASPDELRMLTRNVH